MSVEWPTELVQRALGARVRARRRAMGLTMQQLAERMEKDPRQVRWIERGASNLTLHSLLRLASALELPLGQLWADEPKALPLAREAEPRFELETALARSPTEVLAAQVTERRKKRRWSQRVLAHRAGLSLSLVKGVESGRNSPTLRSLEVLAAALEVSVIELLGGRPPGRGLTSEGHQRWR
jgi:transcriptional regulator with XRE-family HTH domain